VRPSAKAAMDVVFEVEQRKRSRRSWIIWLAVLLASLIALYLFNHDLIAGWPGQALAIAGIIGVILFLAYLSTRWYGRSTSSFRWWWLR
jgi:cell division protein FtsW (lipid II flippase)